MRLIAAFLAITSITSILCYPTRPLDERKVTWQAWLLVDEQLNPRHTNSEALLSAGMPLRRRITPKSVFIAPTFSPEQLPPCADGYQSDPMGRCIKIIKITEEAYISSLLAHLNDKFPTIPPNGGNPVNGEDDFGNYDLFGEDVSQPEKVDIPLTGGASIKDEMDSTNIAIVVAPTNSDFMAPSPQTTTERVVMDTTTNSVPLETTEMTTETSSEEATTETTVFDSTTTESAAAESTITTDTATETSTMLDTTTEPSTSTQSSIVQFPDDSHLNRRFVRFPSDLEPPVPVASTAAPFVPLTERALNHRSRDRNNLFALPLNWSQSSLMQQQKPVVFRFSRKHTYVDTQLFNKRPDYYRTLPSDDLSFIFGFKHKQNNLNSSIR